VLTTLAHAAADAPSVRHSLRPLFSGGTLTQQPGRIAPRECGVIFQIFCCLKIESTIVMAGLVPAIHVFTS
jgi:hypothetical protein